MDSKEALNELIAIVTKCCMQIKKYDKYCVEIGKLSSIIYKDLEMAELLKMYANAKAEKKDGLRLYDIRIATTKLFTKEESNKIEGWFKNDKQ